MIGYSSQSKRNIPYKNRQLLQIKYDEQKNLDIMDMELKPLTPFSKEQHPTSQKTVIKMPIAMIQSIKLTQRQIQFCLNSECEVQLIKNQTLKQIVIIKRNNQQAKQLQQNAENILKTVVPLMAVSKLFNFGLQLLKGQLEQDESYKFYQQLNNFNGQEILKQPPQGNLDDSRISKSSEQQQDSHTQSLLIRSEDQRRQNEGKNDDRPLVLSRSQHLRYIALITIYQNLLKQQNSKSKQPKLLNDEETSNNKNLRQKNRRYRKNYPGKTLQEIASILIKNFSFTKEEIEVEKQKLLKYEVDFNRISFTQYYFDTQFIKMLSDFPKHQFPQTNISVNSQLLQTSITCTKVNYLFIPCSEKVKHKTKKWKFYHINFLIELTIPTVQITPIYNQENNQAKHSQNCNKQIKGFWISINGNRKNYFSKSQVIDQMRGIDLENKANEIEIIHSIWGPKSADQNGQDDAAEHDDFKKEQKLNEEKIKFKDNLLIQNQNEQMLNNQNQKHKTVGQKTSKRESKPWLQEEQLKFIEFFIKYDPVFSNNEQKLGGYRYYKVMSQYLKTRTLDQCYDHHTAIMRSYKTYKQFIQKQSKILQLNKQSFQHKLKQNIHQWIKNDDPIVLIERRERAREYFIKQSPQTINDQKVRSLLNNVIEGFKIEFILSNDLIKDVEDDDVFQHSQKTHIAEFSDRIQTTKPEKFIAKKRQVKTIQKSHLIIPMNWKDVQARLLYQKITENQPQIGEYLQRDKESKISIRVGFTLKIRKRNDK